MTMLRDYLCVLVDKMPTRTDAGLYLPEQAIKERPIGLVDQIGPDVKNVRSGDRVVFDAYAGTTIMVEDVEYRFMHEVDVMAVL